MIIKRGMKLPKETIGDGYKQISKKAAKELHGLGATILWDMQILGDEEPEFIWDEVSQYSESFKPYRYYADFFKVKVE